MMDDIQIRMFASPIDGVPDRVFLRPPVGGDRPWVVVLHGHGATGDQLFVREDIRQAWLPILVRRDVGIISPDLRGNAWMGPTAAADLKRMLGTLREEFSFRSLGLVGGSMGGASALVYAGLHPEDISFVVAYCPATDFRGLVQFLSPGAEEDPTRREIIAAIEANYGPVDRLDVYERHSILANHARLTMPTALVHGDDDGLVPVEHSRRLRDLMGTRLRYYREIPGGGHDAPLGCTEPLQMMIDHLDANKGRN